MNQNRIVRLDLRGGLGNQLRTIASAKALPGLLNANFVYLGGEIDGTLDNSVQEMGFALAGTPAKERRFLARGLHNTWRFLGRRLRAESHLRLRAARYPGSRRLLISGDSRAFREPERLHLERSLTVQGFFDDCAYLGFLEGEIKTWFSLKPSQTSPWFKKIRRYIDANRPIGVHVRRSDYSSIPGALLGTEYYERALRVTKELAGAHSPLLVFSDDPDSADGLVSGAAWDGKVVTVRPPNGTSSAESLVALASCEALIAANSTFSWWAAHSGLPKRFLVAPAGRVLNPFLKCDHVTREV